MESSAPQQLREPAGGATVPLGPLEPAVALCRDGEIVWASDRLAELLGREGVLPLEGRPMPELLCEIGEVVEKLDSTRTTAYRIAAPDGDGERIVSVNRIEVPSGDDAKAVELWLLCDTSLESEIKRLGLAVERSDARLDRVRKELNRDRDDLIALLSHELRTPLALISGYSNLLLSERAGKLSDEQRRYLDETRKSCQRLNGFVADLLDAPNHQSGVLNLTLEEGSMIPSIQSVIQFFLPLLEEKNLDVEIDAPSELPLARFDPERIQQVLTNLLGNAVKYTKPGSVISVSAQAAPGGSGPMIEVWITDDGPGIASEESQRIFEPYVRGAGEQREGGVGLGLAICRRILEAHDGEIWVEAAPGRGSRFVFSVPAVVHAPLAGER